MLKGNQHEKGTEQMTGIGTANIVNERQVKRQKDWIKRQSLRPFHPWKTRLKNDPLREKGEPMMTENLKARIKGYEETVKWLERLNLPTGGFTRAGSESK